VNHSAHPRRSVSNIHLTRCAWKIMTSTQRGPCEAGPCYLLATWRASAERSSPRGEAQGDEVGYSFWRSGGAVRFLKQVVAAISKKSQSYRSAPKSGPSPGGTWPPPSPLGRGPRASTFSLAPLGERGVRSRRRVALSRGEQVPHCKCTNSRSQRYRSAPVPLHSSPFLRTARRLSPVSWRGPN